MPSSLGSLAGGSFGQAMMLINGNSGPEEVCLTSGGSAGTPAAESCNDAVRQGDGREIWHLTPQGHLVSWKSGKCLGGKDEMGLWDCTQEEDMLWQLRPDSRLQLGGAGAGGAKATEQAGLDCLNLKAKREEDDLLTDDARGQPAEASSNVGSVSGREAIHAPDRAFDNNPLTYWASESVSAEDDGVTLSVKFPEARLKSVDIDWEFPPKKYDLQLTADGKHWTTVYTVDRNPLHSSTSHIPLRDQTAQGARLYMKATDEEKGKLGPESFYGVKSFKVNVPNYTPELIDCKEGEKHARDRWFPAAVLQFDPASKVCTEPEPKKWKPNRLQADPSWLAPSGAATSLLERHEVYGSQHKAASFLETREDLTMLTRYRSQHRRTMEGFLCSAAGVYNRKVFTGCYSGASPDGTEGKEWCYFEPEVADGLPDGSKNWGYCAPVIDYDAIRKGDA